MNPIKRCFALLLCLALLCSGFAIHAVADSVTDQISIYIGYYGTDPADYACKATYHWSDLDDAYGGALPTFQSAYSYTHDGRVAICSARGFSLSDLLQYAGVDLSSINSLDFYTRDHTAGAYRSFSKYALLDAPRYYFPNLATDENGNLCARDGGDMWSGAVRVETMMALEDNWEWGADGPNFNGMSTANRFRLTLGQLTPDEANTSASAKYVYGIYVTFSGTPVLSSDDPDLDMKLGSTHQVTVNVTAADSVLEDYVRDNLVWSSNQTDVVEVDQYGNLTAKSEGQAVITADYNGTKVSITVTVGDKNSNGSQGKDPGDAGQNKPNQNGGKDPGTPSNGGNQGGNTGGASQPENTQQTNKPANTKPNNSNPSKNTKQPTTATPDTNSDAEVSYSENSAGVYILSKGLMKQLNDADWVNSVLQHPAGESDQTGGVANWRDGKLDEDAAPLSVKSASFGSWPIYCAAGGLLVAGGIGGIASFRSQLFDKRRKK